MLGGQPRCELRSWEVLKEPVSALPSSHLPHTLPMPQFIGSSQVSQLPCLQLLRAQPASSHHTWVKEAPMTAHL